MMLWWLDGEGSAARRLEGSAELLEAPSRRAAEPAHERVRCALTKRTLCVIATGAKTPSKFLFALREIHLVRIVHFSRDRNNFV